MHSESRSISCAAEARLRPRPRRRAVGAAAPPLRPVAGRRARRRWLARRLRRPPAADRRPRPGPAGRVARADMVGAGGARLRFVHVAGATRGMDVTWRIEPRRRGGCTRVAIEHDFAPGFPGSRPFVDRVVHATDRRPDAGHVQGPRRGGRADPTAAGERRPRRRRACERAETNPIDMTDRRRVWITGIGIITAIGTGLDAFRAGFGRAARRSSGSTASTRARSARRSPPRSTTSTRWPGCRPRPPASSTGSASSGWSPAGSPSTTPGRPGRGRRGATRADRDLPRLGARRHRLRRGAARALPRARASARSRRTSPWRCSAARRRPTSASRSTSAGRSSRPPTRARRGRSRSARRSATCARAGSMRRSPAAARSR